MSRGKRGQGEPADVPERDDGAVAVAEASTEERDVAAADATDPEATDAAGPAEPPDPDVAAAVARVVAARAELDARTLRLHELRRAIEAGEAEIEALSEKIARRVADGTEAATLLARRRILRDEVADAEHAAELLVAQVAEAQKALVAAQQAEARARLRVLVDRRLKVAARIDAALDELCVALEQHGELRPQMQNLARAAGVSPDLAAAYGRDRGMRHVVSGRLIPFLKTDVDRPPAEYRGASGATLVDVERRLFGVLPVDG